MGKRAGAPVQPNHIPNAWAIVRAAWNDLCIEMRDAMAAEEIDRESMSGPERRALSRAEENNAEAIKADVRRRVESFVPAIREEPATGENEAPAASEADKPGREYIDMTPTWAAMESTFRLLIENGNAEGRRTAWAEIAKALRLADEWNAMAKAIYALSIVANETAHCTYEPGTMARDEMDSALAAAFDLLDK